MIIDFTVTNFRSIKDSQTISFVAEDKSKSLMQNIAYYPESSLGVLRTAGIYGPNASGKTNILIALKALAYIINKSGDLKKGEQIIHEPFLLSAQKETLNTSFEIEFITSDKKRFLYSISFNRNVIIEESLDYFATNRPSNLFKRRENATWENVEFGSKYKGGKKQYAFFQNNSYLSKAGNSADSPELIQAVYNYFSEGMFHLSVGQSIDTYGWKDDKTAVKRISSILSKIDTGITAIEFEEIEETPEISFPDEIPDDIRKSIINSNKKKAFFIHETKSGNSVKLMESQESAGTLKLFKMLPLLISAFIEGKTLIIDELDNSLHPHLAEFVVNLFNDSDVNTNNAQLIFSSHNLNLLSPNLLRRDQVWFTEKSYGETKLHSLCDFDKNIVKANSPFGRWYDEGRFGATPKIDTGAIKKIIKQFMKEHAKT